MPQLSNTSLTDPAIQLCRRWGSGRAATWPSQPLYPSSLQVMDLIELTPIKDSPVGNPGSGLSVEQRKRLTIAVELVANPSIVFME